MKSKRKRRAVELDSRRKACSRCDTMGAELQEANEPLALLRTDLEVAEHAAQGARRKFEAKRRQYAGLHDFAPGACTTLDKGGYIREAKKSLRDSDSRYRLLFEANPSPMFIFDELTLSFLDVNKAALLLYGYSREAFLSMTVKDIRPREEVPAVMEAIREQRKRMRRGVRGQSKLHMHRRDEPMFAHEWRHEKRDGSLFYAEVTISPIRYAGREARLVLVNDITARKRSELSLQYRLALEQALAGASNRLTNVQQGELDATIHAALADVGRLMGADRCYLFRVSADLATADNTHEWCAKGIRAQYEELRNLQTCEFAWLLSRLREGEPLGISCIDDIPPEAEAERQLMAKGKVQSCVLVPIRHGGRLIGFVGCDAVRAVHRWQDDDVRILRIMGETITEAQDRMRSGEALLSAAREWQATFDSVADAVWLLDADQRILRCNRASEALFGKTSVELEGAQCWAVVHGTEQPIPECPFRCVKKTHARASMELKIGERWYQVVVDPVLGPAGEFRGGIHVVSDITVRKAAVDALRIMSVELERRVEERTAALTRTHRALHVLTEGNRAVVRATTENDLVNELCRIVVEAGGYRMAWVGYAEDDERKTIRLAAQVGVARDCFSGLVLTWAKTGDGRCPAGEAIRTGRLCLCRDIAAQTVSIPCRQSALKSGCVSMLALPLMVERKCLGALVIYSAQAGAFDDSEVQLLQQVADDLAYGIVSLRRDRERQKLERQVLDISECERRRIGQDLHDGVGQSLTGIRYLLSAVQQSFPDKRSPEYSELTRISEMMGKTVQEVHDLTRGMFPGELQRGSLEDALRELAAHTQSVYRIECRFSCCRVARQMDANLASQMYRIAQEAMNNAAKHSRCKTIDVKLVRTHGRVALTVQDDGVGIDRLDENSVGMGLRIMQYRAAVIGADLNVESTRGRGTTVICVLPPGVATGAAARTALRRGKEMTP